MTAGGFKGERQPPLPGAPTGVPAGAWDTHLKKWPHTHRPTELCPIISKMCYIHGRGRAVIALGLGLSAVIAFSKNLFFQKNASKRTVILF